LRVRAAGGNANNGANAGTFYSNANYTATNANANYSSLLYFARYIKQNAIWAGPCHLAKDNKNAEGAGRSVRFRQFPKRAEQTQTDPQTR
ncbi:hypothetical protein, partial [Bacteroides salyersiae]|uniref:hypothetical protein n=1 Tax=Bacteroides salyersiae TaxID=291644 RepID=UPI0034A34ABC